MKCPHCGKLIKRKIKRVKYLCQDIHILEGKFPNFHCSGSVKSMRKIYGEEALLVQQGDYIYNVETEPELYVLAH